MRDGVVSSLALAGKVTEAILATSRAAPTDSRLRAALALLGKLTMYP
jgi:hypothetical protein